MNIFKKLRKEKGFTLDKLSEVMQFSRSYISMVENNRANPSAKYIENFSEILQLNGSVTAQIYIAYGLSEKLDLNSVDKEKLLEQGFIEKDDTDTNSQIKVLNKPYYNIHWLLSQNDNDVVMSRNIEYDFGHIERESIILTQEEKRKLLDYIEAIPMLRNFDVIEENKED